MNPMTLKTTVSMAGLLLLVVASTAAAQFGRQPTRSGVCFYKDADFRGESFCLEPGEQLESVGGRLDDEISSIRFYGRLDVTVYKDKRFRGDSRRYSSDVRDLGREGFNDRISSIQVSRVSGGGFGGGFGGGRPGGDPDRIIRRAYQDLLNREPDAQGLREYRRRMIDDGWSEQDVREAIRRSREYREHTTMTYPKAQAIVRQAYLSVLRREPDSGAEGYVNRVLRDGWTQQDVERELRRSPEAQGRRPR